MCCLSLREKLITMRGGENIKLKYFSEWSKKSEKGLPLKRNVIIIPSDPNIRTPCKDRNARFTTVS